MSTATMPAASWIASPRSMLNVWPSAVTNPPRVAPIRRAMRSGKPGASVAPRAVRSTSCGPRPGSTSARRASCRARSRTVRNARPSAASWWASGSVTRRTRSASSTGRSAGRPRSTSRSSRTRRSRTRARVTGVDDHPGETRVHRQLRHTTAEIGGSTGVVERTEGRQEFDRLRPACGVGWGEEGQGCRSMIARRARSRATGAMSSSVMAGGAWGGRAACSAFDQSRIATPGPDDGAPGPLISRRPTAVDRMQATHPGSGVGRAVRSSRCRRRR